MLDNVKLHWPEARGWMWDYCVYLGGYTHPENKHNYDLGVYINPFGEVSAAIVFGNEPGNYMSGDLEDFVRAFNNPIYVETLRRAKEIGLLD